ncbi:hypothetical protein HRG_001234 [Hirsutella rhossiliensis]|uniref:Uncharacterized protein n=1 Tax=Hirsutella rhossiliensis TaxID=111463 RepID=A0A9P8NCF5_9HYPO|nr:uncharacterized protein HRG_01234 [Hirsutella rhossiliensis]KAH0968592.1 hypothetical protein HRG_01234 [Hirsutella rhossiliensis]
MNGQLLKTEYLPIQIGGIFAAYGVSLLLVSMILALLSKKRRLHNDNRATAMSTHLYGSGHGPALAFPTDKTSLLPLDELALKKGYFSTTNSMPHPASAVPYSPYQPGMFCTTVTSFLVTEQDRKQAKRMAPVGPVLEMVKSPDEIW